ncbi:MAG: ATP-binding cassette domain-containing protein [Alphaproteobacteria bacterium]|nr:ATP-binding cassette domain-containing protein [Alphaproteobacteria bacterium]
MADAPLALARVTKSFAGRPAVRELSFEVPRGSILGFLGPNGAGKSTSLRIALGVLAPDSGMVSLFGRPPRIDALRRVGFLPEERGLYRRMSARATIAYFARLKGVPARQADARALLLLETHGLGDSAGKPVSKLSKGMAQKVQILSTLAHDPELIILDEPFSGLDPVNQQGLEALIVDAHARGATIVFSTHVMEHAERLCDRLVVIAKGEKRFEGSVPEALALIPRRATVTVANGFELGAAMSGQGFLAAAESECEGGRRWRVDLPRGRDAQDALRAAIGSGAPVTAFTPETVRLRDVFVSLAGEAAPGDTGVPGPAETGVPGKAA